MKRHLVTALLAFLPLAALAEMKLDGGRVNVNPKPDDETISVDFTFQNAGTKPVRILSLESGCHCLSATLDKPTYAPGEKGKGTAEFKVGAFTGTSEKLVLVSTDDPQQTEWSIPFLLHLPKVISIEPENVQWWVGEQPAPKQLTIKVVGPDPMNIIDITATRETVGFKQEVKQPGREYVITLTPKTTAEVVIGALKIKTDSTVAKFSNQLAFFSIVRQPESRKNEATAGQVADKP